MNYFRINFPILPQTIILLSSVFVFGQSTPDQHIQHHPQTVEASPLPTAAASTPTPKMSNTNTGGMSEMMNGMGKSPPKEIYPSLMELPNLTPEKRAELERLAQERINEGNSLLNQAREKMSNPATAQNPAVMRDATAQMRQGLMLIESGLAAQTALSENKNPQETSFKWFKKNMNLAPAAEVEQPHGFFGLSWFHYFSMLSLAAFSAAMIWMYFRKMKRADALVKRLSDGGDTALELSSVEQPAVLNSSVQPIPVNTEIAPSKSNSWTGTLRVAQIFEETPFVKTFRLVEPSGGKFPFSYLPGQFITVTVAPAGLSVKRSYTIASSPTQRDSCEITVKREEHGTVSAYLHDCVHEGELLQFTGPSGAFTFTGEESKSVVLIAGGVGVTPMMSAIRYLTDRSWRGEIYFLFGCFSEQNIIYREEIEYLQRRHKNLHVTILLEEPPTKTGESRYLTGRITKEILTGRVPEITSRRVHICGPPPMLDAVKEMLAELDVPPENIKTEVFVGKLPAPKTSSAVIDQSAAAAVVNFARSKKSAMLTPDKTILEASEEVGVNIDYSCRVGTCGICKTTLLSGKVTMEVEDALTEEDKGNNIILACQAKATEDVAVDA